MRVAILTSLKEFNTSYSLVSVVQGQAEALVKYGHQVGLFVCEHLDPETWEWCRVSPANRFSLINAIPEIEDRICYVKRSDLTPGHRNLADNLHAGLKPLLESYDVILTHDLIFTGWNMPYAEALMKLCADLPDKPFFHWIHSIPGNRFDWWDLSLYGRNSTLVYPTSSDIFRVAERFKCSVRDALTVPHIVDLRIIDNFSAAGCAFINDYPALMSADVVQIFPASSERLRGKGLDRLILAFSELKRRGHSVCLICANQHTNPQNRIENLQWYRGIAERNGLRRGEFAFTSNWQGGRYSTGIPRTLLRDISKCSNVFLNPSIAESFGLVTPEASLWGGVIPIHNESLDCQSEIAGGRGLYVKMGSFKAPWQPRNEGVFFKDLADIIEDQLRRDQAAAQRTHYRQTLNMDFVYKQYYEPLLRKGLN